MVWLLCLARKQEEKAMKSIIQAICIAFVILSGAIFAEELADAEIRKLLIQQSIDSYSGSCPCPYNRARNGSRCGKRSAYSKPGGAEPLCYDNDVTDEMVERYRARLKK